MTEQQYSELCSACDALLLAPDVSRERVAIPWLHVIREHPVFLANYSQIFAEEPLPVAFRRRAVGFLRNTGSMIRQFGRAWMGSGELWAASGHLPSRVDVLVVSHLLNAAQAGARDFYFGDVPEALAKQGCSVLVALFNHCREPGRPLVAKWTQEKVPRVILASTLPLATEISLVRKLRAEAARLRRMARAQPEGLLRRVAHRAAQEAQSSGARAAGRLGVQIADLVAQYKPRVVVTLHEGHSWERIAFAAAREAHAGVRCVGYQHAVLFRLQHAVRRNLGRPYDPDHILTSGTLGKRLLDAAKGLRGIKTSVLGSNRGFAVQASPPLARAAFEGRPARRKCVVLPEGILSECDLLFEFSLRCAELCPEVEFVWRLHPLVTFAALEARNPAFCNLPSNVRMSRDTFENDLAGGSWALYRGTTAIVQAVGAGLRPVYLRLPDEMTIDPLFELHGWKTSVETGDEFRALTRTAAPHAKDPDREQAQGYCREIFEPFKADELARLVCLALS